MNELPRLNPGVGVYIYIFVVVVVTCFAALLWSLSGILRGGGWWGVRSSKSINQTSSAPITSALCCARVCLCFLKTGVLRKCAFRTTYFR